MFSDICRFIFGLGLSEASALEKGQPGFEDKNGPGIQSLKHNGLLALFLLANEPDE